MCCLVGFVGVPRNRARYCNAQRCEKRTEIRKSFVFLCGLCGKPYASQDLIEPACVSKTLQPPLFSRGATLCDKVFLQHFHRHDKAIKKMLVL